MFLSGLTPCQIAKTLTAEGIPSPAGKTKWSYTTVRRVLSNETYMGDKLLQKTYSIDFLSKDRLKNKGQVPQYYVEGDHEAIIPPSTFRRVQDEIERRKGGHSTGGSIFSGKIYCGDCGQIYGSKVWHSNDPYRKVVWQCNDKFKGDKCRTPTITEEDIKRAFEKLLVKLKEEEVLENLKEIKVGDTAPLRKEKARLEKERDNIGLLAQQAISENARVAQDQMAYNERYNELAAEYERLDTEVRRVEHEIEVIKSRQRRLEEFIKAMEAAGEEFTEALWASLVEKVTVYKDGLAFSLTNGEEVRI